MKGTRSIRTSGESRVVLLFILSFWGVVLRGWETSCCKVVLSVDIDLRFKALCDNLTKLKQTERSISLISLLSLLFGEILHFKGDLRTISIKRCFIVVTWYSRINWLIYYNIVRTIFWTELIAFTFNGVWRS